MNLLSKELEFFDLLHVTRNGSALSFQMAIRTFGELLYHPEPGCFDEFPSPEELKHHIILSTKPPKEYLESKNPREKENTSPMEKNFSGEDFWEKGTPKLTAELEADQGVSKEVYISSSLNIARDLFSSIFHMDCRGCRETTIRMKMVMPTIIHHASLVNQKFSMWLQFMHLAPG